MALTIFEAAKMAQRPLIRGLLTTVTKYDQLMARMRWRNVVGDAYRYTRELSIGSAGYISPTATSVPESSATFDDVTVPVRVLLEDFYVSALAIEAQGAQNDPVAIQAMQKAKAVSHTLSAKAIGGAHVTSATYSPAVAAIDATVVGPFNDSVRFGPGSLKYTHVGTLWQYRAPGDRVYGEAVAIAADGSATLYSENPSKWIRITVDVSDIIADAEVHVTFASTNNEPDGLAKMNANLIASIGTNGDAFTFDKLDALITEVQAGAEEDKVFVAHGKVIERMYEAHRALGFAPQTISLPGYGGAIPTYRGYPILRNDSIPTNESKGSSSTLSSVYFMSLDPTEGFYGVCVGAEETRLNMSPLEVTIMGLRLEDVGTRDDRDSRQWRLKHYGAFALGSQKACARASEIETA